MFLEWAVTQVNSGSTPQCYLLAETWSSAEQKDERPACCSFITLTDGPTERKKMTEVRVRENTKLDHHQ